MRDNLVHKETPETLNGLNIQSGVVMVMMQLKDTDIIYAGDKARGEYRGFAALHDLMDANMLLPYTAKFSSSDEHALAYWTKLMNQVTIVLCNIWDVRNEAQLKKQNALQSRK